MQKILNKTTLLSLLFLVSFIYQMQSTLKILNPTDNAASHNVVFAKDQKKKVADVRVKITRAVALRNEKNSRIAAASKGIDRKFW